jgi:hypothetical protein
VSGGQDGNVIIYDGKLRSNKPIVCFEQGKTMVCMLIYLVSSESCN